MRHDWICLAALTGIAALLLSGCWGTPKVSTWAAPKNLTYEQVYNAAVRAGGDNGFTVVSSDRGAGAISMQREYYGGEHKDERRTMSVNVRPSGESVQVSTKTMGTDFGIWDNGGSFGRKNQRGAHPTVLHEPLPRVAGYGPCCPYHHDG
jgi:hypothetical protein